MACRRQLTLKLLYICIDTSNDHTAAEGCLSTPLIVLIHKMMYSQHQHHVVLLQVEASWLPPGIRMDVADAMVALAQAAACGQ